jgi:hypothetical protein
MTQFDGSVSVDEGYRAAVAGAGSSRSPSRAAARASRSSPGSWSEDLGQYGSERWNLPGMGESAPRCGEWYPEAVCTEHGHVDMTTHSCGRRSCPECWGMWAKEAAVRATVRVQAFRYTQPPDHRRQVAHAVVSPEEGDVMTTREFFDGKSKASEMAKEKGFRGHTVIAHPFRATEEAKAAYRAEDPNVGLWVWLRAEFDNWREWVYWSPHYHVVGATTEDMDPAADSDEWVYHFMRSVESFDGTGDMESHEDLYGLFRYLLSHTGYPEGSTRQVTTWYGCLANSVFVEDASEEWQYPKPSEGVLSVLEREVEEVAGLPSEEDEEGGGDEESDDLGECPVEDCEGLLIDVWDIRAYLDHNEVRREVADRMVVAREWRLGDRLPPPGLKQPRSEEEAREAFEAML